MTKRDCRRCGTPLTKENARTYDGRWVGACRLCENAEQYERKGLPLPAHYPPRKKAAA